MGQQRYTDEFKREAVRQVTDSESCSLSNVQMLAGMLILNHIRETFASAQSIEKSPYNEVA